MTATLDPEQIGPVDVAVIAFVGNEFNGDIAPALNELEQSGIVRIIDLAFVQKDADGATTILEVEDGDVADLLAGTNGDQFDLLSEEDLVEIAEQLDPASSALVIVWENAWAARLGAAIRGSNGALVAYERIPRDTVLHAIAALDEE